MILMLRFFAVRSFSHGIDSLLRPVKPGFQSEMLTVI